MLRQVEERQPLTPEMWVAVAGAATTPNVTVTVKKLSSTSTLVRIVNCDHVT